MDRQTNNKKVEIRGERDDAFPIHCYHSSPFLVHTACIPPTSYASSRPHAVTLEHPEHERYAPPGNVSLLHHLSDTLLATMQVDSDKVHQRGLDINMSTPPTGTSTQPTSPTRFTTSVNAFGLSASPSSSSSSHRDGPSNLLNPETSPLSGVRQRLRRPSMLSLAHPVQPVDRTDGSEDEEEEMAENGPPRPRSTNPFDGPRWGPGFLGMAHRSESGSNLPFASLTTSTPPIPTDERMDEALPVDQSPPRWLPGHLQRRRGKLQNEEIGPGLHRPPFTGRPLPAPLLATLISETTPHEHEIQSEARLQRLISSHPRAVPFTPRTSRSSRGRFPETAGDDDDEDDFPSRRAIWAARAWTRRDSSDSDSDDMPEDAPEPVNSAFAAGMDMDRVGSSSESGYPEGSGKSTPGSNPVASVTTPQGPLGWEKSRPPRMSFSAGLAPSPGGFGLPSAFGGLGMGTGTPLGSPTIERLEVSRSIGQR